jgi:hypothetical protein
MPDIAALVALLRLATKDRAQLVLENIALRHQLAGPHGRTAHESLVAQPLVRALGVVVLDELVACPTQGVLAEPK